MMGKTDQLQNFVEETRLEHRGDERLTFQMQPKEVHCEGREKYCSQGRSLFSFGFGISDVQIAGCATTEFVQLSVVLNSVEMSRVVRKGRELKRGMKCHRKDNMHIPRISDLTELEPGSLQQWMAVNLFMTDFMAGCCIEQQDLNISFARPREHGCCCTQAFNCRLRVTGLPTYRTLCLRYCLNHLLC